MGKGYWNGLQKALGFIACQQALPIGLAKLITNNGYYARTSRSSGNWSATKSRLTPSWAVLGVDALAAPARIDAVSRSMTQS
jgi:hypothetical protein